MRKRRGITLIEFLVSGLIFLIVSAAVLTLLPYSAFATTHSRSRIQADLVASSVIDQYRAKPFSSLSPQAAQVLSTMTMENGKEFVPTVELVTVPSVPPNKALELRVEVAWRDSSGKRSLVRGLVLSNVSTQ